MAFFGNFPKAPDAGAEPKSDRILGQRQRVDNCPPIDRLSASKVPKRDPTVRPRPARRPRSGRASPSRRGPSNSIFKEFQQLGRQKAVLGLDNLSGKDVPSFQVQDPEISPSRPNSSRAISSASVFPKPYKQLTLPMAPSVCERRYGPADVARQVVSGFFPRGIGFRRSVYRRASPQLRIRSCPSGT
jgi:hypothetical protein